MSSGAGEEVFGEDDLILGNPSILEGGTEGLELPEDSSLESELSAYGSGFRLDRKTAELFETLSGVEAQALLRHEHSLLPASQKYLLLELLKEYQEERPNLKAAGGRSGLSRHAVSMCLQAGTASRPCRRFKRVYTLVLLMSRLTPEENNFNLRKLIDVSFKEGKLDTAQRALQMAMQSAGQFNVPPQVTNTNIINISVSDSEILLNSMVRRDVAVVPEEDAELTVKEEDNERA